jgi:hypothetical protein
MRAADMFSGVLEFIGVLHDSDRREYTTSVATNAKPIDNGAEHHYKSCDIIDVCNVGQHTASGDINVHECNSRCRDSFLGC